MPVTTQRFIHQATRLLICLAVAATSLLAGTQAFAQPVPLNDQCGGAEVIPATGPFPYAAAAVDVTNATGTPSAPNGDPVPTCNTSSWSRGIWYKFTPTVSGTYSFATCSTGGYGSSTRNDTVLGVYTSSDGTCAGTMTALPGAAGCDDDGCGFGDGWQSVTNSPLTAGTTYYIVAYSYGTSTPSAGAASIGLRVTQGTGADACGSVPSIGVNSLTSGVTGGFTNDFQVGPACYVGIGNTTSATASGRDAVYAFTAPAPGKYSFRVGRFDSDVPNAVLYLSTTCPSGTPPTTLAAGCFAANRTSASSSSSEEVSCVPMVGGDTIYAVIDESTQSTNGTPYLLEVSPCVEEVEPNVQATPNTLACGIKGAINPAGDVDYFDVGAHAAGERIFAVVDGVASNNTNYDMRLVDSTITLEYDNSDNDALLGASSPNIAGRALPAGQALLRVNQNSSTATAEPYRLYSVIQPPAGRPETEPNNTLLSATGGSTYFSGALSASSDVDFFAFNAAAGDTVYIGLDTDPGRDNTPFNGALALFDPQGNQLMIAADGTSTSSTTAGTSHTSTVPNSPGEAIVFLLPSSGTYFARVTGSASGDYLLSISRNCTNAGVVLTSLSPAVGAVAGGTTVTVNGYGFTPGVAVNIGGNAVTPSSVSPTQLTFVTPAAPAGTVAVVVTLPDGRSSSLPFTYLPPPTISSITPASGRTAGGTAVTISGTNFRSGATVTFNGTAATGVTVVSATSITATTPAGAAGPATVVVTNTDTGQTASSTAFTYVPPPSVTSLNPNSGFTIGGTTVVITGQNFQNGATVTFDGSPAPVTFDSSTQLTVTTPGHAPGQVNVVVTNPDGQSTTVTNGYEYVTLGPPPTVTSVTPATGTTAGGTSVVIEGTGFFNGATVTFGGTAATAVNFVSATQLTATTPAHAFGPVDVVVTNIDFQSGTLTNGFTYEHPAPTLTSIAPTQGTTLGGTTVTLTGANYLPGATVSFDGVPATGVTVVNSTTITAKTPAHAAGTADVQITNADGKQVTLAQAFTFVAPPAPTSISPTSGTTLGGESFTLTGTAFGPGATVSFGGTAATNVTVVNATTITGTTPARAAGTVSVVVTNPDGQTGTLANAFTFIPPPALSSISPTSGPTAGGTNVTVTGSNFVSGATLSIGGTPATNVTVVSATQITATTAASTDGTVDVVVTNPDGQISTLPGAFTYYAPPAISAVSPSSGPTLGGTLVTITGDKFRPGAVVLFGSSTVPASVVSATQITATTPPHAAGTVDVIVRNSDNQSATLTGGFTFFAPPSVTSLTPGKGPAAGGTTVTITGSAFRPGASVTFGNAQATNVTVVDAQTLTAVTPAHDTGFVDVVVTNPDNQQGTLFQSFEYLEAPAVASLSPTFGPVSGGTTVALTGSGFRPGIKVQFGGAMATSVVLESSTSLTAVTPAHPAGPVDLTVINPDGQSSQLDDAFTFQAVAPTLTLVTPAQGPGDGLTPVLLAGTGFQPGATVTFGGVPATEVVVVNVNSITARTPPHAQGEVDVVVTNPDMTSATLPNGYRYTSSPDAGSPDAGVDAGTPDAGAVDAGTVDYNGGSTGCGCTSTDASSLMGFALVALGSLFSRRRSRSAKK